MTEKWWLCFALGVVLLPSTPASALAGDGLVALQTADPSCPDGSGDIYVDCGNGTVTDNRTGLVWLKDANCLAEVDPEDGAVHWYTAMEFVAGLSDLPGNDPDDCGLSDGSSPGEWRLPSVEEWEAMVADAVALGCVDTQFGGPSITDDSGESCWQEGPGNSFSGVQSPCYWSSTTAAHLSLDISQAAVGNLDHGIWNSTSKTNSYYVWPVRGSAAVAGSGVVALQTAGPSCGDDSANVYVDCGNGTVTDNRTGLVWLKNANCLNTDWYTAMETISGLSDGAFADCGLSDGSSPGEWRLPSIAEWEAMTADAVALGCSPTITNDSGNACWSLLCAAVGDCSFTGVESSGYWSSTSTTFNAAEGVLLMFLTDGFYLSIAKSPDFYVWPVRGGQ
jgi:hypothetical protein